MSENYKDMENLEEVRKLINEASLEGGACSAVLACTPVGGAIAGATAGAFLGPVGALLGSGIGFLLNKNIEEKRKERLRQEKEALYTKAIQVQSAIIEKLKNKVSMAEQNSKHLLAINEKLQVAIRKLKEDLGK